MLLHFPKRCQSRQRTLPWGSTSLPALFWWQRACCPSHMVALLHFWTSECSAKHTAHNVSALNAAWGKPFRPLGTSSSFPSMALLLRGLPLSTDCSRSRFLDAPLDAAKFSCCQSLRSTTSWRSFPILRCASPPRRERRVTDKGPPCPVCSAEPRRCANARVTSLTVVVGPRRARN